MSISSYADKIYLKNGSSVGGRIVSVDNENVTLSVSFGEVGEAFTSYPKSEIEYIEKGGDDSPYKGTKRYKEKKDKNKKTDNKEEAATWIVTLKNKLYSFFKK